MTSKPVYFCHLLSLKKPRAPASEHAWPNLSENLCPCVCPCPQIKVPGTVEICDGHWPLPRSQCCEEQPALAQPPTYSVSREVVSVFWKEEGGPSS